MKNRKLEQILSSYQDGTTLKELKEKYGIQVKDLRALIKRNLGRKRRLSKEEVINLRNDVSSNWGTREQIGKKYGVSASLVSSIARFRIYTDVGGPLTYKLKPKRSGYHVYEDRNIEEMRYLYWNHNWTAKRIAEKFPQDGRVLPISSIYNILHKRRYKHVVNFGDTEWERVVQQYKKAA